MKILSIFLVALFALTGCASTSDLEALQGRVSAVESATKVSSSEISALKDKVAKCEAKMEKCDTHCKTLESKLDKMFKKSQYK